MRRSTPMATHGSRLEVLLVATRLGLTSFGGPVAHLGYFRDEYVVRRRWLDEEAYADLVALCQFLPGPASSQVGIAIGMLRAGLLGGVAAWVGFTLPSAAALVAFAYGLDAFDVGDAGWLHGLAVAAVAVVANAVWGMARNLTPDAPRATLAVAAAALVLAAQEPLTQVLAIAGGALVGLLVLRGEGGRAMVRRRALRVPLGARGALVVLAVFLVLLGGLPLARQASDAEILAFVDGFYRAGSLVFGGGHVVLPLLESEVVPRWVSAEDFLAGYGAAQAVPGPLFAFAAYLGAASEGEPGGAGGAALALTVIYLPSFLLIVGVLPYWQALRGLPAAQAALRGVGAAVVGVLLAALYTPVWTGAILEGRDFALALAAFVALAAWRLPPWVVVVGAALGGQLLAEF